MLSNSINDGDDLSTVMRLTVEKSHEGFVYFEWRVPLQSGLGGWQQPGYDAFNDQCLQASSNICLRVWPLLPIHPCCSLQILLVATFLGSTFLSWRFVRLNVYMDAFSPLRIVICSDNPLPAANMRSPWRAAVGFRNWSSDPVKG